MPEPPRDPPAGRGILSALIEELRRRRVFRVAGIYLVTGSGFIQGAGALLGPFNLSPAVMKGLSWLVVAGFPVAVLASWAYDLQLHRESQPEGAAAPRWAGARGRLLFAAGIVVGMVLLAVVVTHWGPGRDPRTARRPVLGIYAVESSAPAGRPFAEMLRRNLNDALMQSRGIEVKEADFVAGWYQQNRRPDSVAADLGLDYLVGASFSERDADTQLTVRVLDARGVPVAAPGRFNAGPRSEESAEDLGGRAAQYVLRVIAARLEEEAWRFGTRSDSAFVHLNSAHELIARGTTLLEAGDVAGVRRQYEGASALLARSMAEDPRWDQPLALGSSMAAHWAAAAFLDKDSVAVDTILAQGLATVERLLRRRPNPPEGLVARGMLRYYQVMLEQQTDSAARAQLLEQAQQDFERALELDPRLPGAAMQLTDLLFNRGEFARARERADWALSVDAFGERASDLSYYLAITTFETGEDTVALRICRNALRRFGNQQVLHGCVLEVAAFGTAPPDVADAWRHLARIQAARDSSANAFYESAMAAVLARARLRDSAEHVLTRARRAYPEEFRRNDNLLWVEAAVRFRLQQRDSAADLLRAFAERRPPNLSLILSRRVLRGFLDRS
ncbi:MAG: hypothetical protein FIB01_16130 [Gemmatimonadetes bacterium]|nr:hypothetical protein [Gemmatimonadota bacterium]